MSRPHVSPPTYCRVLDPCTLGRPFHLLDEFNQRLGRQFSRYLKSRFNHRYGADFSVGQVAIGPYAAARGGMMWRTYVSELGALSIRLERRVLLAMLHYQYGDRDDMALDEHVPETETERRFGVATGLALLDVFRASLAGPGNGGYTPEPMQAPAAGNRVLRIEISERSLGIAGLLELAVDEAWLDLIFAAAAPRRAVASDLKTDRVPLAARLPITLSVRMLTKQVLLDEVIRLAPGDVLPIRMPGTADVLAGDELLCRAAVVERGGTLCLTSLEYAE